jgi:hypothetical protein
VLVINSVYPAIVRSGNSLTRVATKLDDRIESQIKVVYATAELDENEVWQDGGTAGKFDVDFWVKNVGVSRIVGVDQSDVFFGIEGDFARIPYVTDAGGGYPQWSYTLENGTEWTSSVTLNFTVLYESSLSTDEYFLKVIAPNGAYDDHYFSF